MPDVAPIPWLDDLRRLALLNATQLDELSRTRLTPEELTRRGWLTSYQVERLQQGEGDSLLFGRYELMQPLGEGGMGQVFKARDRQHGLIVALKVIRKERLDNPEIARRFRREIQFATMLDHPNIVRVVDANEVQGTFYLAMELVEGVDLSKLVQRAGPLAIDRACGFIRQAALGLQHAHERGLVHRDVKPQNMLLLGATRSIKLMDMGLALGTADIDEGSGTMTKTGTVMGTLDYLAPEQAMDAHHVDIRADIYSLGCSFYHLLTGRPPFASSNSLNKLYAHRHAAPIPFEQSRPEVPRGVGLVVRKLMAKQPSDRFQTPAEVAAVLATWNGTDVDVTGLAEPPAVVPLLVATPVMPSPMQAAMDTAAGSKASTGDLAFDLSSTLMRPTPPKSRRHELGWLVFAVLVAALVVLVGWLLFSLLPRLRTPATVASGNADPPRPDSSGDKPAPVVDPAFEAWRKRTEGLSGAAQMAAVTAKLRETNGSWLTTIVTPVMSGGVVTEVKFSSSEGMTDIRALSAMKGLRRLRLTAKLDNAALMDLRPLEGMPLELLHLSRNTKLSDIRPLHDMPVYDLNLDSTSVVDLGPLNTASKLKILDISSTPVSNLEPLGNCPLEELRANNTEISDLEPLRGLPLKILHISKTKVTSLAPLKGKSIDNLWFDVQPERDADVLLSLKNLKILNNRPAATVLKELGIAPK